MNDKEKPRLFPEHFNIGKYSGSPRDFTKGKISMPRGGEDPLELWYSEDPDESEYFDKDFQKNVNDRIEILKKQGWDPTRKFIATTQSHLDLGWMWHFRQGVAKAERTFSKVHGHFQLFKPFTFTGSQPACYQWVKFNSPDIWENVVQDVKDGRHEVQGGCWCEADGRMPSGEAWVRQRLYGQLFYARNFGKIGNVAWFPDSFGYADNLPQIFSKSGSDGFMTSKLVSNKQTKWPFWAWLWEAPDGSRLLSYQSGIHQKLGPLGGYDVRQSDSDVRESYIKAYRLLKPNTTLTITYETDQPENHENVSDEEIPFLGCFFGEGDGGHGPQGVEMAFYRAFVERGYAEWVSTHEIYSRLQQYQDRLPIWKDELYYEFHRGSLTSQTLMKRMNRFFEWRLPFIEGLHSIATSITNKPLESFKHFYEDELDQIRTTDNPIEQIWQNILLMQFHDVLPGSSLPEVYDECYEFWHQDKFLLKRLEEDAMAGLVSALNIHGLKPVKIHLEMENLDILMLPAFIMNATGGSGPQLIEICLDILKGSVPIGLLDDTKIYPIQKLAADPLGQDLDKKRERYIYPSNLPSWTCKIVYLITLSHSYQNEANVEKYLKAAADKIGINEIMKIECSIKENEDSFELKSPNLILKINKITGKLDQIIIDGQNLLHAPSDLKTFQDKPYTNPSWNLQENWWNLPIDNFTKTPKIEIIDKGPVQWTLRITRPFGTGSNALIDYYIAANTPGFGVNIGIDFHETETLVKYELPLNINTEYTIAETPYSTNKRKNKPTANHDIPRWEKWMHTFVLLENEKENRGIAVINEGKYGYDTFHDKLTLSIVHGPEYVETNVVAWAVDERKKRKEAGLGEPPTHQDQGEHFTRLWILPYDGNWKEGRIHNTAHLFNSPPSVCIITNDVAAFVDYTDQRFEPMVRQFISSSPANVEVAVVKKAEKLPDCMLAKNREVNQSVGLILRVLNNADKLTKGEISIDPIILSGGKSIIETDLLERRINPEWKLDIPSNLEDRFVFTAEFKPHEIKTYKILK